MKEKFELMFAEAASLAKKSDELLTNFMKELAEENGGRYTFKFPVVVCTMAHDDINMEAIEVIEGEVYAVAEETGHKYKMIQLCAGQMRKLATAIFFML